MSLIDDSSMLTTFGAHDAGDLALRPHDAAVEHARNAHMLHVLICAADLVGMSGRGTRVPTILYSDGDLSGAISGLFRGIAAPRAS